MSYGGVLPDVITIYQGPIEEDCETLAEMEELVRDTVVHEVGHYFGLDDDRLSELEEGSG
jgi:predicted Zn-dependent protease with MMP-like domain